MRSAARLLLMVVPPQPLLDQACLEHQVPGAPARELPMGRKDKGDARCTYVQRLNTARRLTKNTAAAYLLVCQPPRHSSRCKCLI